MAKEIENKSVTFYCKEYPALSIDIESPRYDIINGRQVFHSGKSVRFVNDSLTTDDVETIETIRKLSLYGIKITEEGVDHSKPSRA